MSTIELEGVRVAAGLNLTDTQGREFFVKILYTWLESVEVTIVSATIAKTPFDFKPRTYRVVYEKGFIKAIVESARDIRGWLVVEGFSEEEVDKFLPPA